VKISDLGERNIVERLVKRLRRDPSVIADLHDDAAIFDPQGKRLVLSTDMGVLSTHFTNPDPEKMGRKIVASHVSDVICKGALPKYFFHCFTAPPDTDISFLEKLYDGMDGELKKYDAFLLGGDTNKGTEFVYSGALLGFLDGPPLLRNAAQPGDAIYLTGEIGNAALGYLSRKKHFVVPQKFLDAQDAPELDWALCKRILSEGKMHAGIDVSDGLAFELHELARLSKKRIVIDWDRLPLNPDLERLCKEHDLNAEDVALNHGEDYQIVFSGEKGASGIPIGEVTDGSGVFLKCDNQVRPLENKGYEHFKSN